eukprot:2147400-Amphidinium_carterae.1
MPGDIEEMELLRKNKPQGRDSGRYGGRGSGREREERQRRHTGPRKPQRQKPQRQKVPGVKAQNAQQTLSQRIRRGSAR